MHIQFWGTRGSIATPGPGTVRYGGNTSCVEVRSARGTLVVIDSGTGAHPLGQKLMSAGAAAVRGHILISHTHWDHIQGLPFFAPLFVPGNQWDIYGPKGLGQSLRETLAAQMQYAYFPVTSEQFGATIRYHDLVEGRFCIDDIAVSAQYLNHPALTLGYRLEADGAALLYCCDHEPYSRALAGGKGEFAGQELRHSEFVQGADLLVHDAQYTAAEYQAKIGWGHSTVEYAVSLGQQARVKRLALTHHDPLRDDDAIDRLLAQIRGVLREQASSLDVFAAAEGERVEVESSGSEAPAGGAQEFEATTPIEPAPADRSVLLGIADPRVAAMLSEAIRAEGIRSVVISDSEQASRLVVRERPSLALLEHDAARFDGLRMCRDIRLSGGDDGRQLPVIIVAAHEDFAAGSAAGVTDWLITPFSSAYARTKIRAWVLRTACRWIRASLPDNESQRMTALRELRILDTEPEERFDRVTRLAAALFDVPMALISLVDDDRQWFKSRVGLNVKETPRDSAFCAHVVYSREPMVVPDAAADARFADNPLVVNEPRIRFYAGYPLILDDGSCVGTLCLLDVRPRSLPGFGLERLRDLADIALREIRQSRK